MCVPWQKLILGLCCAFFVYLSLSERKEKRIINVYFILFQMPGRKDLVIDGELMKPLDRIASVSLLKVKYEIHLTCAMCNLSTST